MDRRLQTLQRFLLEQLNRELSDRQGALLHVLCSAACTLLNG